jgi:hypothetical protein
MIQEEKEDNKPKKKVFVLKMYGADLYRWSPLPTNYSKTKTRNKERPFFCNAYPNTQGQDWNTTYVYNVGILKFKQQRLAYVECDYVE